MDNASPAVGGESGAADDGARPSLLMLARTWLAIGSQSVGGGPSTMYMIRSLMVERTRWISPETFRECWTIGQASPGIHLIALAGLLGHQLHGKRGIAVAVIAFVVPSAIITTLFTAGLELVESQPVVQGMLRGIIPATGGMTLSLAFFFGRTTARKGRIGWADWLIVLVAAMLVGGAQAPVVLVLLGAAIIGALLAYYPSWTGTGHT
ncbi:MAG: chromate transporter [Chloroflexota bacterium]